MIPLHVKRISLHFLHQPALPLDPFLARRCGELQKSNRTMLLCPPRMKIVGLVSPEPCPLVRLISCDLFAPGSLKSGTPNFWKMDGAQKVTFSIQNLYSQMHFRSQMCPGGHLEGLEACLKRRSELRTRARNLLAF